MKKTQREQSLSTVDVSPVVTQLIDHGPALSEQRESKGVAPAVTLLSDFGTRDGYVAQMKLAVLARCPSARLIDVTHEISPQDVVAGSIMLEQVLAGAMQIKLNMPSKDSDAALPGIIHLAVVDPGVGTHRRMMVAQVAGQWIVCPDNGLITWAWRRHSPCVAYELTWRPKQSSSTFHGRDIMGPVAGILAAKMQAAGSAGMKQWPVVMKQWIAAEKLAGQAIDEKKPCGPAKGGSVIEANLNWPVFGPRVKPILLPISPAKAGSRRGRVIHIDHFGNAMTSLTDEGIATITRAKSTGRSKTLFVHAGGKRISAIRQTYGDVKPGEPLSLIGSSGLLEIAIHGGSAAKELSLSVGDVVELKDVD